MTMSLLRNLKPIIVAHTPLPPFFFHDMLSATAPSWMFLVYWFFCSITSNRVILYCLPLRVGHVKWVTPIFPDNLFVFLFTQYFSLFFSVCDTILAPFLCIYLCLLKVVFCHTNDLSSSMVLLKQQKTDTLVNAVIEISHFNLMYKFRFWATWLLCISIGNGNEWGVCM